MILARAVNKVPSKLQLKSSEIRILDFESMAITENIPIILLKDHERLWLEEVYRRNYAGDKFTYKEIWKILHAKLPITFRPVAMDERLISASGEEIRLLGIIALNKDLKILDQIDKVILYIRDYILNNSDVEHLHIEKIARDLDDPIELVSLLLQVISDYGRFYSGASSKIDTKHYATINLSGNDNVFYTYIGYPGIRELVAQKLMKDKQQDIDETFTLDEQLRANSRIDEILSDLQELKMGHEIIFTELTEMKELYGINKKNWRQLLQGKLGDMILGGIITEPIAQRISYTINPVIDNLLE